MDVFINDQVITVDDDAVLNSVLSAHVSGQKGIAVAVNNEIVPTDNWEHHRLLEGDKILIIVATQGG